MNFDVTESQKKRLNRCMAGNMKLQSDIEKLQKKILDIERPFLSSQKKAALRSNVLKQVSLAEQYEVETGFAKVVDYIKMVAGFLKLETKSRVEMKERVFAVIGGVPQRSFFFRNIFVFHKKLISGVLTISLFFGMFSFVSVDTSVVMAQVFTTLESFSGDVVVMRDGKNLVIREGIELFEGDEIFTGDDGMAVVKYFDDSITRLSFNTEVAINRLFKAEGSMKTYIEVSLEDGVAWSRITSLAGDKSVFVLKSKDVLAVTKKATFNAEFKDQKLKLEVFNRSVDVQKNDRVEKVLKGQKAVVNGDVEVFVLAESEKNEPWVKSNLESDKQYLATVENRLLDAKVKSMGADASLGMSLREDIAVFLTFSDVDKAKKELDLAEKKLVAAEIKLASPDLNEQDIVEIEKVLVLFSDKSKEFSQLVKEVGYTDKEYAAELKRFLDNKILIHQKELSAILPDSPLYQVKKVVDDVALANVDNDAELVQKKLDQVSDKLASAEDAATLGQSDVARSVVDDSQQELNNVVQIMGNMEQSTPGSAENLGPKVNEVQQYLTALSGEPAMSVAGGSVVTTPVITAADVTQSSVTVNVSEDDSVQKTEYGIYIKGDKPLPPGFSR